MIFTVSNTSDCFTKPLETKEINTIEDLMKIIDDKSKETQQACLLMIGYYNGKPHICIDN